MCVCVQCICVRLITARLSMGRTGPESQAMHSFRPAFLQAAREAAFSKFDTNKDGVVAQDELKAGMQRKFGMDVTESQMAALFDEFDKNKDGVLQIDEFQVSVPCVRCGSRGALRRSIHVAHASRWCGGAGGIDKVAAREPSARRAGNREGEGAAAERGIAS